MKPVLLALLLVMNTSTFAQSDFDRSIDKENEAVVLKGQITFDDLKKESSFKWLESGFEKYAPDSTSVRFLKKHLTEFKIVVLLGTWCDDSQNLIPKLYKTLALANYPLSQYSMYGVDRSKQAKYIEHRLYRVDKVPTIILFKDFTEIGRIVEVTKKSIEQDITQLIQTHSRHPKEDEYLK